MKLARRAAFFALFAAVTATILACPSEERPSSSSAAGGNSVGSSMRSTGAGDPTGTGGADGVSELSTVLAALRADTGAAMQTYAMERGFPLALTDGYLFVSTDPGLAFVAGDHDMWQGTAMKQDKGFAWALVSAKPGNRYKFTDKTTWKADPWARSYTYDDHGEISLIEPSIPHLDRWVGVFSEGLSPRLLRVWVPEGPVTHELYVHDGQNLFDPQAPWGGWRLQAVVPKGMLLVGIDNSPERMDEYTHVADVIEGKPMGGKGEQYADFLKNTVRPLIRKHYGEPGPVGVMGSSLGGLISLHIADREPKEYAFAASLSGTLGWGSIGQGIHHQTMVDRYKAHGHRQTVLYLDSGGDGASCADSDGDGVDDDDDKASDNYCENKQMRDVLVSMGYKEDKELFYVWKKGAKHNEAAWASRVSVPLGIFAGL